MNAAPASGSDRGSSARDHILEAAALAFAEHGYHGLSMRRLAKVANRSPASFYNHFESKEDLLFCLQRDAFTDLLKSARDSVAKATKPREKLCAFVDNHVRYFAEHRSLMRVLVHEAGTLPSERRAPIRLLKEQYFALARSLVSQHIEETDPRELERITYGIFGMLNWMYAWYEPAHHGCVEELSLTLQRQVLGAVGPSKDRRLRTTGCL